MYDKFQYEANDGYHAVIFGDYHGQSQHTGYECEGTVCIYNNGVESVCIKKIWDLDEQEFVDEIVLDGIEITTGAIYRFGDVEMQMLVESIYYFRTVRHDEDYLDDHIDADVGLQEYLTRRTMDQLSERKGALRKQQLKEKLKEADHRGAEWYEQGGNRTT